MHKVKNFNVPNYESRYYPINMPFHHLLELNCLNYTADSLSHIPPFGLVVITEVFSTIRPLTTSSN